MKYHNFDKITSLKENEVFIFGANASGFHGAGSAGYAFKGDTKNDWRTNEKCQAAIKAIREKRDSSVVVGKWAIWGQARGLMRGREGESYAIVTTERPGFQGNITLQSVENELINLCRVAEQMNNKTFLLVPLGLSRQFGGFSWFTLDEMKSIFKSIETQFGIPDNVLLPRKFE